MSATWAKRVVSLRWSSTSRPLYSITLATPLASKGGRPSSAQRVRMKRATLTMFSAVQSIWLAKSARTLNSFWNSSS